MEMEATQGFRRRSVLPPASQGVAKEWLPEVTMKKQQE